MNKAEISTHILQHHYKLYHTIALLCGGKSAQVPAYEWAKASSGNNYPAFIFNENSELIDTEEVKVGVLNKSLPPFWLTADEHLGQIISKAGFRKIQVWQAMAMNKADLINPGDQEGLYFKTVSTPEDLSIWTALMSSQFNAAQEENYFFPLLEDDRFDFFLGYKNEEPITTTMNFYWHDTVGVHMVVTRKDHRGQGIGQRAFYHALKAAFDLGVQQAICSATPKGANAWQRLGFKIHTKLYLYWQVSKANV